MSVRSSGHRPFVPFVGEVNDPKKFGCYVETLGYLSIKQQIQRFQPQAGSLIAEQYDTDSDYPDDDPTLAMRDMDLAEIGHEIVMQQSKLESSAKQAAAIKEAAESSKPEAAKSDPN